MKTNTSRPGPVGGLTYKEMTIYWKQEIWETDEESVIGGDGYINTAGV